MVHNMVTLLLVLCVTGATLGHHIGILPIPLIKTYTVSPNAATWIDAYIQCEQNGTELASIESLQEERRLESLLNRTSSGEEDVRYWTSGRKGDDESSPFVWFVNGKALTYKNWADGQPDNAGKREDCLEIIVRKNPINDRWNDQNCLLTRRFVCQTKNCVRNHWG